MGSFPEMYNELTQPGRVSRLPCFFLAISRNTDVVLPLPSKENPLSISKILHIIIVSPIQRFLNNYENNNDEDDDDDDDKSDNTVEPPLNGHPQLSGRGRGLHFAVLRRVLPLFSPLSKELCRYRT